MSYLIADEPHDSSHPKLVVHPQAALLAQMLCGSWLALPSSVMGRAGAALSAKNDARAAANTNATKQDVLAELARNVPPMAAWVRGLSDEQLDRTAPLSLADGAPVSTEQLLLGGVLIDHVNGHLKSIEAATAGVR